MPLVFQRQISRSRKRGQVSRPFIATSKRVHGVVGLRWVPAPPFFNGCLNSIWRLPAVAAAMPLFSNNFYTLTRYMDFPILHHAHLGLGYHSFSTPDLVLREARSGFRLAAHSLRFLAPPNVSTAYRVPAPFFRNILHPSLECFLYPRTIYRPPAITVNM